MNNFKFGKKIGGRIAVIVLALIMLFSVISAVVLSSGLFNASAAGERVTMLDLMARYPIDFVVGPVDVVDIYPVNEDGTTGDGVIDRNDLSITGKYTYKESNYEKDALGNPVLHTCTVQDCGHQVSSDGYILTNNTYGIPADKYFNVESYIYTTGVKDSDAGRTLYGWKAGIRACVNKSDSTTPRAEKLAENGEILSAGGRLTETASPIGIYVTFGSITGRNDEAINDVGSTEKYAIIVPSDITAVGQGSGAFATEEAAYYADPDNVEKTVMYSAGSDGYVEYTDFACFLTDRLLNGNNTPNIHYGRAPYFWQPRERLAGVYFPDDSRLKTIQSGTEEAYGVADSTNRTKPGSNGKAAFQGCDNMRFMVLPSGVETVGDYAFANCTKIVDTNIPSSVTTIGTKAYKRCSALMCISVPDGATVETDTFEECGSFKDPESIIVMANRPQNGVLDTGAFLFEKNSDGALTALSIAGETGEDPNKVFAFPSGADFTDSSDRRRGVAYDYLDSDAKKIKNILGEDATAVTEYDIATEFAKDTWCQNVILPKEVKTIGARAFFGAHVSYLETYATTIGSQAFSEGTYTAAKTEQWLYIHQMPDADGNYTDSGYDIAANAFSVVHSGGTRNIVFENYALYNAFGGDAPSWLKNLGDADHPNNFKVHYQIPIIVNVNNEDPQSLTFKDGDMAELFFNDSDYTKNPTLVTGNNSIVYTKKLNLYGFNQTKQKTGGWVGDDALEGKHSSPTLGNMDSTVWYGAADYSGNTVTAKGLFTGSETGAVNLYTKNIARPENIKDGTYDGEYKGNYSFGQTYTFGDISIMLGDDDTQSIPYALALGLSDDYAITLTRFIYADGKTNGKDVTTSLHHAGSYEFSISLNTKWGVWSNAYIEADSDYFTAEATIARWGIDFTSLDKVPQFVNAAQGGVALYGNATPIYKYNEGWYVAQNNGLEPNDTRVVTNSFAYFSDKPITIMLQGEMVSEDGNSSTIQIEDGKQGAYYVTSRNGLTFAPSSSYTASLVFEVKKIDNANNQSDYYFNYGENTYNETDEMTGLSMTNKQDFSFRLTKRWYIVIETNMFVVSGSDSSSPYAPVTDTNIRYADAITAQKPALNKGNNVGTIEFEIMYTPLNGKATTIKEKSLLGDNENSIGYYINSSMPAGEYTLKLYGSEVKVSETGEGGTTTERTYSAITGEYTIVVLPKAFDSKLVKEIHDIMNVNGVAGNAYPLDRNKALHDSIDDQVGALTNKLDMPASGNYWSDKAQYFDSKVAVTYNVDGSGNTAYYNAQTTLNNLNTAGKYTLYYCISAKNYQTVGGADATDRTDHSFVTTLYTEMRFDDIYSQILDVTSPYFKDVTFTGSQAQTLVPRNQYYNYSFDDVDANGDANYINARTKASVTLKLYDPELTRWNTTLVNANNEFTDEEINNAINYYALSADKQSLKIFFNINPATNSWNVVPQMPSWSFNGFDTTVNFITADLTFDGAEVEYELSSDLIAWTAPFTVDSNGMVDDVTAELLNKLKPGAYYLRSTISDITYVNEDGETVTNVQGIEFITQNSVGNYITSLSISKAVNGWTETPTVMTWTWGSYDKDRNTISAAAIYPTLKPTYGNVVDKEFVYTNGGNALPVITFSIRKAGEATPIAGLGNFTIGDDVSAILAGLHAGQYVLTTSVGGSDYYTPITATSTNFEIAQAVNSWTTTPQITQWTWGQFKQNVNVILAEAQFNGGDGSEGSQDNAITFSILNGSHVAVNATLSNFVLTQGAYGEDVAIALEALPAGTYYLRAEKVGNNDYASIAGSNNTDILFTVATASNSWQISPAVTSWQYSRFDADSNFIAGIPTYSTADSVVYKLLKDGSEITLGYTYEDGKIKLNAAAVKVLTELTVGKNYTINVALAGTDNYSALPATLTFSVTPVNNNWDTTPRLSSFKYGQFVAASNFTAGEPLYPTDDKTVQYGIFNKNIANSVSFVAETSGIKFSAIAGDVTAYLNGLNAGKYFFVAYVPSDGNYSELFLCTEFDVSLTTNAWDNGNVPAISGWTYNAFNADLFTDGSANHGAPIYDIYLVDEQGNVIKDKDGKNVVAKVGETVLKELTFSSLSAILNNLASGRYNLHAYVEETGNYAGVTHDVRFAVAKAANSWATYPGIVGWTYGAYNAEVNKRTDGVAVHEVNGTKSYVYYSAISINGVWEANLSSPVTTIDATTPAGMYALVVKFDSTESDNYEGVTHTAIFEIDRANNTWQTGCEPEGTFTWIWGQSSSVVTSASGFIKAQASYHDSDEKVTYQIKYSNGTYAEPIYRNGNNADDISALLNALANLPIGNYEITVSVAATNNYAGIERTTYVTVSPATFTWNNAPQSVTWTWDGDKNSETTAYLAFVEPTIVAVPDTGVTVTYKLMGKNGEVAGITDFASLQNALKGIDVDVYAVTVTVSCDNYVTLIHNTAKITVNVAENVWTANNPIATLYKVFSDDTFAIQLAEAKFGTVQYFDVDGNEITDINAWLQGLTQASDEAYIFVTRVAATDNYPELKQTTEVFVTGVNSTWDNTWTPVVEYTYGDDIDWSALVLPLHDLTNDVAIGLTSSTLTYTIKFVSADKSFEKTIEDLATANSVRGSLANDGNFTDKDGIVYRAGTYTIFATYDPDSGNYTKLHAGVKVNVHQDSAEWSQQLALEYRGAYQAIEIPTPAANYYVTVTVTDSDGNAYDWNRTEYETLQAFVRTLNVGDYTIVSQVEATNNYTGTSKVTTRVIISPALNDWTDSSVLQSQHSLKRLDETYYVVVPQALRGDVECSIDGKSISDFAGVQITTVGEETRITGLCNLEISSHTLSFVVAAGDNGNYNGLRYDCSIVVSVNTNSWKTAPDTSKSWTGKVTVSEFTTPEASFHNELLRYEITKVGDSSFSVKTGLDQNAFETALAGLVNGTYIVTMRVGGSVEKYSQDNSATKELVEIYNSNYSELVATTEITVTRQFNSWRTPFVGSSWTWGDDVEITRPIAAHGESNHMIVYTLNGVEANGTEVSTTIDGKIRDNQYDAVTAYERLIDYLSKCKAGTYTVTATIAASDEYEAPQATTALFSINKVVPAWTMSSVELANYQNISWAYGSDFSDKLPKLKLADNWSGAITYRVNDTILSDIEDTDINEGTWSYYFNGKTAGTYRIIASVAGGDNNEALTFEGTVTISLSDNEWTVSPTNKAMSWAYGKAEEIVYKPAHNNERGKVTVKINNVEVLIKINEEFSIESDLTFQKYFNDNCSVGTYTVTITVDADTMYAGLTDTFTVVITKSKDNGWVEGEFALTDWTWNNSKQPMGAGEAQLTVPTPKYGNSVIVTVKDGNNVEQFVVTLTYTGGNVNSAELDSFKAKLWALNAGENYSIHVEIPETNDHAAFVQEEDVTFTISKATNTWKSEEDEPHITGWDYNATTAYPASDPTYGNKNDVVYEYAPAQYDANDQVIDLSALAKSEKTEDQDLLNSLLEDIVWKTTLPINAGMYYIRGTLEGTTNYSALVGYGSFPINMGINDWVDQPGVVAWNWNNYDRNVNQFSGSSRNEGTVTFYILKPNPESESGYGSLDASDFLVFNGEQLIPSQIKLLNDGFSFETVDGKPVRTISQNVATVLNALKPGTYRLRVVAAATVNYGELVRNTTLTVGKATNEWTTAPNVLSYDYDGYVASSDDVASGNRVTFTAGASKYGTSTIRYLVVDSNGKVVVVEGLTTAATTQLTAAQVEDLLRELKAGNYALQAWVTADENAIYGSLPITTVLFSVNRIANEWTSERQTAIEEYYTVLHATNDGNYTFDFAAKFAELSTKYTAKITYTVFDTNYNKLKDKDGNDIESCEYSGLFANILKLGAGNYVIRVTAEETISVTSLSADTSLTIKRQANSFTAFPTSNLSGQWQLSGKWQPTGNVFATTLDAFTVTADYGTDTITYTLNGVKCTTAKELDDEVAKLNAGSYQVVIAVEQTNDYEGLSRTVQLDIKQGTNKLVWSLDTNDWTWHNGLERFTAEIPTYGNQIVVEISGGNLTSASSVTISFPNTFALINQIICGSQTKDGIVGGLDAGTYTIKVTASADANGNWAEITNTAEFTIAPTANGWKIDNEPALNGTLKDEVYVYSYGDVITPSAAAQHGVVKYTYYVNDAAYAQGKATPLSGKPANVGKYVVEVSVDATTNYEGIEAIKLYFDIDKVLNDRFVVSPAAVGWTWGSYNRTVHTFTGIPRSYGSVSFSILDEYKNVVLIDNVALDKMLLVGLTENGEQHFMIGNQDDFDRNMYLESKFAPLVAKLKEGNYYLQINVAATDNNEEFTNSDARFRVEAAQNGWDVTPKIASWSLGLWSAEQNSPQAKPKFGEVHIVVTSKNNNEVFYDNAKLVYNEKTGENEILNRLKNALAGWYTMTVTVDEVEGCYDGLYETVDVQVYVRGSNETKNYWYESYGIVPWEARVDGIGSEPYGTPLRGLPYFEFYYAKGEGSTATIDWDRPVVEGEDSYLVSKGDNKYYKDFYVPMKPGYYFMVACAVNVDSDGKVIEADNLREIKTPYPLHIEYRVNDFTDDPHIDTLLFLGDRANWADPTSTPSIKDSDIWYTYKNADTGEDLGTTKPNAEGRYIVVAHAVAKYSKEITKEAKFTVELSTNEWLEQPTIEDWSEEFMDKDPESLAKFGADSVIYTYENLETGEIKNEKPTTEGTYKMTATIKLEGFKDLVGTVTFTIDPAFDSDLLIIDIVLGLVACALAIFVIIFAIRRYKEN